MLRRAQKGSKELFIGLQKIFIKDDVFSIAIIHNTLNLWLRTLEERIDNIRVLR